MINKDSEPKKKDHKNYSNSIFSKENVNMEHQPEFDYLKSLGVIVMTVTHLNVAFTEFFLFKVLEDIELTISAGGLMFLMGLGMKYSHHHEKKYYVYRGIVLLTLAQYFNFLRDTLPNLIAWWTTGNKKFISRALLIVRGDILTFAGLAYFLIALMEKMKLSDVSILIISFIMNCISYPLFKIMKSPSNFLISQFLGYFILTDAEAYFPLCGYFFFVACGNWMGGIYQKISNKDKFYNLILIFCFPIALIYQYFKKNKKIPYLPEYNSYEHFCLSPGPDAIHRLMCQLSILAIYYKIDKILGKTPYLIKHFGKNFNQYYMISYIIIMHMSTFLKATRGEKSTSEMKNLNLLAVIIIVFCWILIDMNDKYIHFAITTLRNKKRNIIFTLIWIITIVSIIYIYPKVEVYSTMWNDYLYER